MLRAICSKHETTCRSCGARQAAGSAIYYDKESQRGHRALCIPCFKRSHAADQPQQPAPQQVPQQVPQQGNAPRRGLVESTDASLTGRYDCLSDFIEDAERPADFQTGYWRRGEPRYWIRRFDSDWYGLKAETDFAGVKALVNGGWSDGLTRLTEALAELPEIAAPVCVKRRRVHSDTGDEIDIHRVNRGDLNHAWSTMRRQERVGPASATITVDSVARSSQNADELFWKGAAAVRLAELLTASGYQVELVSAFRGCSHGGTPVSLRVVVKAADSPLDLCAAAAALALPAFFRCIGHAWIFSNLAHYEEEGRGIVVEQLTAKDGDFVAGQRICSQGSAADWIAEQVNFLNTQRLAA